MVYTTSIAFHKYQPEDDLFEINLPLPSTSLSSRAGANVCEHHRCSSYEVPEVQASGIIPLKQMTQTRMEEVSLERVLKTKKMVIGSSSFQSNSCYDTVLSLSPAALQGNTITIQNTASFSAVIGLKYKLFCNC